MFISISDSEISKLEEHYGIMNALVMQRNRDLFRDSHNMIIAIEMK